MASWATSPCLRRRLWWRAVYGLAGGRRGSHNQGHGTVQASAVKCTQKLQRSPGKQGRKDKSRKGVETAFAGKRRSCRAQTRAYTTPRLARYLGLRIAEESIKQEIQERGNPPPSLDDYR